MFKSIDEVKIFNAICGQGFFEPYTIKTTNSKVESPLYKGKFFITSEYGGDEKCFKKYTVRCVEKSGFIISASKFAEFKKYKDAKKAMKTIAKSK